MANLILLIGKSGSGKSSSLRRLSPKNTLLFKAINKRLPFQEKKLGWKELLRFNNETNKFELINEDGNYIVTSDTKDIIELTKSAVEKGFKNIIIDDGTYTMISEYMDRLDEKGWDKFNDLAYNIWNLHLLAQELPNDINIYLIWHIDTDDFNNAKLRLIGKLVDEKIDIPALVTITILADNKKFYTNNKQIAKSPFGMFKNDEQPNDLAYIDSIIRDYYEMEKVEYLDYDPFEK